MKTLAKSALLTFMIMLLVTVTNQAYSQTNRKNFDRIEDRMDRREDKRDRKENRRDRREDRSDRKH